MDDLTDTATQVARHLRTRPISPISVIVTMAAADAILLACSLWLAAFRSWPRTEFAPHHAAVTAVAAAISAAIILAAAEAYRPRRLLRLGPAAAGALAGAVLAAALGVLLAAPGQ
ncbi:hypothetical protein, partial [Mangrovicoccus algicola]